VSLGEQTSDFGEKTSELLTCFPKLPRDTILRKEKKRKKIEKKTKKSEKNMKF